MNQKTVNKLFSALVFLAIAAVGFLLIRRGSAIGPESYLVLGAMIFAIGTAGVLMRKNSLVVFMSIELMLNAVNLTFITFARAKGTLDGQVLAFFVIVVAAAEVVVGLAIIVSIFRPRSTASVDEARSLKW